MSDTLGDRVEEARRRLTQDPATAGDQAERLLDEAAATGDRAQAAAAATVALLALLRQGRVEPAAVLADRAVAEAEAAGDPALLADALTVRMGVHIQRGRPDAALADAARAGPLAPPAVAVRLELQRGLLLAYSFGQVAEGAAVYAAAAAPVRALGDVEITFRFQNNWGLMQLRLGEVTAAVRCFAAARAAADALDDPWRRSAAGWNEAMAAARLGDFARVFELHAALGSAEDTSDARDLIDRADALATAHLHLESRDAAEAAVAAAEAAGDRTAALEARVRVAEAALELGDGPAATIAGATAAEQAPAVAPAYGAVARYALVRARLATAGADPDVVAELAAAAGELRSAGWFTAADEATLGAASAALAAGDPATAAALSAPLTAAPAHRLPAAARLRHAHAVAVHRLATGDRAGARRAVRTGLRVLDQHRASLGATELRAHAAAAGQRLAELGLGMALADGDGRRALAWAERARAASLRLDAARDADDPELTADLARLRGLAEGGVSRATASVGDDGERRRLERRVAERLRRSRQAVTAEASLPPAALVAAVADRVLVEYVRDGAVLAAVVVSGGRARLVRLGVALDALGAEVDATGFALRRLIRAAVSGRHVDVAVANLEAAAARLDALVVAPIACYLADRAVVVVPTAPLHGVPWSALPALADRPVAVASSATLWARAEAAAAPDPSGGALLVAGPDLPGAPLEVAELAPLHRDASVLAGARATSGALAAALPGASLLHVAAHGRFRADNPLFSSLLLADGPLTANDLERLRPLPPHVVLAACEVGQAQVRAGDELLGLASVLFPAGVRTLVASLALAPDAATHVLMAAYHRAVAAGTHPATALRDARRVARATGPAGQAAAAAFCCFGWG